MLTQCGFNIQKKKKKREVEKREGEEARGRGGEEGEREWEQMRGERMGGRKCLEIEAGESDREAVEQIKVKLSAFTYLDERF